MRVLTASVLCVLFGSSAAFANSNASNDTGRSSKTAGQTCNSSCHSPTGSAPTVALTGPATLAAGATGNFTLALTANAAPNTQSGCDIATSSAQATLALTTANLTLANGELVQKTPLAFTNGTATYDFKVTAPATAGSFTVYAYGMATNGSGTGGDNGKAATPLVVNVTGGAPADMGATTDAGVAPTDDMAMAPAGNGGGGGTGGGSGGGGGTPSPTPAADMAATPIGGLPGCSMTPSHGGAGASAMLALMLLAFALVRRRRSVS
jgi:MYXO-CTERM domain-containing protein